MTTFVGSAQLNDYKYMIVPKKFDGFKNENQYQTSTVVKFLFERNGFTAVYADNLPLDLTKDRCLGLTVGFVDKSSMFTTKTILELKDCTGEVVFKTNEGRSKKKEYKASYNEALSQSFDSFASLNYSYEPKVVEIEQSEPEQEEPVTVSFKNDVKTVNDTLMIDKKDDAMVDQIATKEVQYYKDNRPVESNIKKGASTAEKKMVEQKATKEEQSFKSMEPVASEIRKASDISAAKTIVGVLYAQEIPNGYQLVDSTPKIQLKIFKSSMPNVYIAKADDKDGVVYTSDGKWFFEHYEVDQVIREELEIKF